MPFTLAHIAVVLPLIARDEAQRQRQRPPQHPRRYPWFDATCLVAGAVAPDFEYFLHARMESNLSHTLIGLLVFDVPIALGIATVFHVLVREPLALALPSSIASRFTRFLARKWCPPLHVAITSALIGAVTHVAWDACTHRTGFVVRMLPFLEQHVIVDGFPLYRLLQHASTALGLVAIAIVVARLPRCPPGTSPGAARGANGAGVVFIAVPLVFGAGAAALRVAVEDGGRVRPRDRGVHLGCVARDLRGVARGEARCAHRSSGASASPVAPRSRAARRRGIALPCARLARLRRSSDAAARA